METFKENEHLKIQFDQERNILFVRWSTHEYMEDEEYRKEIENYAESIAKYQPTSILMHLKKAAYTVPVDTQDWITASIIPLYDKYNTQKVAFIMSTDFMTQLSVEQLVDDANDKTKVQFHFFDDEQQGLDWFLGNKNAAEQVA